MIELAIIGGLGFAALIAARKYTKDVDRYFDGLTRAMPETENNIEAIDPFFSVDYADEVVYTDAAEIVYGLNEGEDMAGKNVSAFLAIIREGESDNDYYRLVGAGTKRFTNPSDHPAFTGEFGPVQYYKGWKPSLVSYAVKTKNGLYSTAAGANQITATTWVSLGGKNTYGDFSPESQDMAAVDLIKRRGAMPAISRGDIFEAARLLSQEWEMFQTARWKNHARLLSTFTRYGGVYGGNMA